MSKAPRSKRICSSKCVGGCDEDDGAHGRAGLEVLYTNWSETAAGNKHTVALATGAKVQEKIRPLSSNFGPLVAIFSVLTIFVEKVELYPAEADVLASI